MKHRHRNRQPPHVAIISHPDAGKTTLFERLPRTGTAMQMAVNVRAKVERRTRADWMGSKRAGGQGPGLDAEERGSQSLLGK